MTDTMTFVRKAAPDWLLAFWKEIGDKTFGKGFDCFVEDATCRLGVAEWNGREAIADLGFAFASLARQRARVERCPHRPSPFGVSVLLTSRSFAN